ncbi:MAG: hypothetical protein NT023_23295 [Armatimonadetes bacterium]|nr:hypothetical protein [Armatimonadota bacterium]
MIVFVNEQAKASGDIVLNVSTHSTIAAHKTRLPLPPFRVLAFHNAGQSAPFVASGVLVSAKQTGVSPQWSVQTGFA